MVEKKRVLVQKRRDRVNTLCDKFREDILALLNEELSEVSDGVWDDTTDDLNLLRGSGLDVEQLDFNGEITYKLKLVKPF